MDEKILNVLRKNTSQYASGELLSKELGISRAAVWKHIENLRKTGYVIEAEPHSGYKFISAPDRLLASEISFGLDTKIIAKKILSFDAVNSTMDSAYDFATKVKTEGVCIFAETQTKGRGRMGRPWQSPKHKGIYMSVILRPDIAPSEISKITLMVGVSVAKTIRAKTGLNALIKWPNDILIDGKKVCGILTDMNAESDKIKFLVVGIGINVNSLAHDLPIGATSLMAATGSKIDRVDFARALLEELDRYYLNFTKHGFSAILDEWRGFSATLGKRVKADFRNKRITGEAIDVDESGALLIRLDNGCTERILSGDVT